MLYQEDKRDLFFTENEMDSALTRGKATFPGVDEITHEILRLLRHVPGSLFPSYAARVLQLVNFGNIGQPYFSLYQTNVNQTPSLQSPLPVVSVQHSKGWSSTVF